MRYRASEKRRLFSKAKNCFAFRSIIEQIIILRARLIARFFDLGRVWARARAIARPLGQGLVNPSNVDSLESLLSLSLSLRCSLSLLLSPPFSLPLSLPLSLSCLIQKAQVLL